MGNDLTGQTAQRLWAKLEIAQNLPARLRKPGSWTALMRHGIGGQQSRTLRGSRVSEKVRGRMSFPPPFLRNMCVSVEWAVNTPRR